MPITFGRVQRAGSGMRMELNYVSLEIVCVERIQAEENDAEEETDFELHG